MRRIAERAQSTPRVRFDVDRVTHRVLRSWAILTAAIILWILGFLAWESWPAIERVGLWRFVTDPSWHPAGGSLTGRFNLVPMITATLVLSVGALFLAAPAGWISAVFCVFYAPRWLAVGYRRLIELLAGIPSVVYGFWGLVTLVPWIRRLEPPGQSLLAGILILALMVLPTVALLAESALRSVPREDLTQATALGLGRLAIVRDVVWVSARPGIATGTLLALARAVGETMAVLMVCGNIVQVPSSVFDPVRALTANIALEMAYATSDHRAALFVSGLVLMLVVALLIGWAARFDGVAAGEAS